MNLPRVTIVIASYNYAEYVGNCIQSALRQDYEGILNICVVDDGSTDGSWQVIKHQFSDQIVETEVCLSSGDKANDLLIMDEMIDGKHLVAIKQKNSGASSARNTAIDYAWDITDIYGILDADDEYYPSKVRLCVDKMLDSMETIGVVYTDYDIEYTETNFTKTEFKEPYNGLRLKQSCIVHSGSLVNKRALEQIKENGEYYDTSLHGPGSQGFIGCSEDYDLWLRIAEKFMIVHLPTPLAVARETGRNQTSNVTEESEQRTRQIIQNKIIARQQTKA